MDRRNTGQASPQPPAPDPELQRLATLIGAWATEAQTQASLLGPGVTVTSTETFQWLEGGYFLVSTYETVFDDEPAQKGVMYWDYDSETRRFRNIFFSNNGPFTEEGNRYEGVVAEGKLTFTGPARFQYELDDAGRIKVNADGSITVDWWLRDSNGAWKPWMSNRFTRIEEAASNFTEQK